MGLVELIEKLITEHGSSQILREHLVLLRTKLSNAESAHKQTQAEKEELATQLEQSQHQLRQAQAALDRLQTGALANVRCDQCGGIDLRRTGTREHPVFGQIGQREAVLVCEECGTTSHIEIPLA